MSNNPKLSLTFRVDSGVLEHNNRSFKAKNVDASLTGDNITYKTENIEEKYHELFDKALDEYNAKNAPTKRYPTTTNISEKENRRNRSMRWLFILAMWGAAG